LKKYAEKDKGMFGGILGQDAGQLFNGSGSSPSALGRSAARLNGGPAAPKQMRDLSGGPAAPRQAGGPAAPKQINFKKPPNPFGPMVSNPSGGPAAPQNGRPAAPQGGGMGPRGVGVQPWTAGRIARGAGNIALDTYTDQKGYLAFQGAAAGTGAGWRAGKKALGFAPPKAPGMFTRPTGRATKLMRKIPGVKQLQRAGTTGASQLARSGGRLASAAGKFGRFAGPAGLAVAPLEFGYNTLKEAPMMFQTDPRTGRNRFAQHVEDRTNEAGDFDRILPGMPGWDWLSDEGPKSYVGNALRTSFSPSTMAGIAKSPFDIAAQTNRSAQNRAQENTAQERLNTQRSNQGPHDNRLAQWGVDPSISSKYQQKYIDETPWYALAGANPWAGREGRMGWVDKRTGEEADKGTLSRIEGARENWRSRQPMPQRAPSASGAPSAPQQAAAPSGPQESVNLLNNPMYQQLMGHVDRNYGGAASAMLLLGGGNPGAFKNMEHLYGGAKSPQEAASAVAKPPSAPAAAQPKAPPRQESAAQTASALRNPTREQASRYWGSANAMAGGGPTY
jgi:hypothetical protein